MGDRGSHRCLQNGQTSRQRPVQVHCQPQPLQQCFQTGKQRELRLRLQRWTQWAGMDLREGPLRMLAERGPRRLP